MKVVCTMECVKEKAKEGRPIPKTKAPYLHHAAEGLEGEKELHIQVVVPQHVDAVVERRLCDISRLMSVWFMGPMSSVRS